MDRRPRLEVFGRFASKAPSPAEAIVRCTLAHFEDYEPDELREALERVVAEREEGDDQESEGDDEG